MMKGRERLCIGGFNEDREMMHDQVLKFKSVQIQVQAQREH